MPESRVYPIVYLPSEIHNRDWDARLLIADYATSLGLSAVVGQQWGLNSHPHMCPPGLVLIKTLNQIQMDVANSYLRHGHVIAAMDEEYFAVAADHGFAGGISSNLPEICHQFFANSPLHAAIIAEKFPEMSDRVIVSGNPRVDLLSSVGRKRYSDEARAIRATLGPFILFNSNLAQGNSIWNSPQQYLQIQIKAGNVDLNDPASVALFNGQFEFERANEAAFMSLLQWSIDHLPEYRIVIRPHPAERKEYWQNFATNRGAHVAVDTHHIPWISAASVVVHTNSTTGLEAALIGTPTVNLAPKSSTVWSDIYVMSRVNPTFENWEDAAVAISAYLRNDSGKLREDSFTEQLLRYFPSAGTVSAAKQIASNMSELLASNEMTSQPPSFDGLRQQLRRFDRGDVLKRKFQKSFEEAQFDFQSIRGVADLHHPVLWSELGESLFLIQPAQ